MNVANGILRPVHYSYRKCIREFLDVDPFDCRTTSEYANKVNAFSSHTCGPITNRMPPVGLIFGGRCRIAQDAYKAFLMFVVLCVGHSDLVAVLQVEDCNTNSHGSVSMGPITQSD